MSFESARRHGRYWDDAIRLHETIRKFPFHTTGKNEREFETGFATTLLSNDDDYNSVVITQIDKSKTVNSVYCFGKKHRPDMTLDENGIAIESKFVKSSGLREAIGQSYLYRLQYRFVFVILIISADKQKLYFDIESGKEPDLENTLQHLADKMNIFVHIVPAFNINANNKPATKKCVSFFEPVNIIS